MKLKNESDTSMAFLGPLLEKVLAFKYVYLVCVVFFVTSALVINKCSRKVYEISSTIGPVESNRSSALASATMFRGAGAYDQGKNVEDALNNLNSFTLISSTVSNMNLEVGYYSEKKSLFKHTTEVYLSSPYIINIDKSHIQPIDAKFYISRLNDSTFRLSSNNRKTYLYNYIDNKVVGKDIYIKVDTVCNFNQTITGSYFKFSVSPNKDILASSSGTKDRFFFKLFHIEEMAKDYQKNLKIEPVSILASIIKIQFTDNNLGKSIAFLNTYINSFLEQNLAKKNKISKNTVTFIDSQISNISDSLVISESKLRNFKSANQVMDLSFQGKNNYEQMAAIETERSKLDGQARYYNYVLDYLRTNQNMSAVVPPASANITDPIMNKLITDLIALNAERSNLFSTNNNDKNLFVAQVDNKIKMQKQAIVENVTGTLNTINITLNELNYKADKLSREISNLPKTEMNMVNIQRKFNLNDANFTYLLQKRSEAQIILASNVPDYEILEPAREITSKITKPKTVINYALSLILALLFPTMFLVLRDLVSNKVSSIYDVEHLLGRPVFGIIYKNPKKYEAVVTESPRSAISESFRNLRSSLFLKMKSPDSKTLVITSSQPQDGKSFISFNLAASIASVGYDTIVIDCDLRRPTLHYKFLKENAYGISEFLNREVKKDQIIHETSVEHLYFIPAGHILPNPSELIDSGALDEVINYLKSKFEYIIIDTPPLGLVSDSMQIAKYASEILVVTRNNVTRKDILLNALTSLESNKIDNYEVVLNDLDLEKSPYSGYKSYYIKE
jgi:capsular exopolysaccharide synthesis family protein